MHPGPPRSIVVCVAVLRAAACVQIELWLQSHALRLVGSLHELVARSR